MQKYPGLPLHRDTGPTLQCLIVTWFYIYYGPCIDNVSAMPLDEYYRITCINPLHVKVIFQHYNGQLHRSWRNDLGVHRIMKISNKHKLYILINILFLNKTTNSLVNIFYLNKKNSKHNNNMIRNYSYVHFMAIHRFSPLSQQYRKAPQSL